MSLFIDVATLCDISGVTRQAIEKALIRLRRNPLETWRGTTLIVRTVRGRGGRSGLRYEVLVSSLPLDLQERLKAAVRASSGPLTLAEGHGAERDWWRAILHPALIHPKGSPERGGAVAAILARPLTDWRGRPIQPSRRTVERKLAALDLHGLAGVTPRQRRDKGSKRVIISGAWDAVVPFDGDTKAEIAGRLRDYIRGLYKDGAAIGVIGTLSAAKLRDLTGTYLRRLPPTGSETAPTLLPVTFNIPRTFIEAEKMFRNVATFRRDRKAYEDTQRPRVQRSRAGLEPMQIIVGDVHHLDIVMRREDGSEAWPKAIAWLDMATNRIRMDIVLLGPGEGIRNADVIRSFIEMTQDPTWGLPRSLYLDNGSEYRWAEFVDDAMKLIETIDYAGDGRDSRIIRARPYNAAAKAIEGIFGTLEQRYFRTIEGWAGGDRTNKKTARVGRPTEPFSGTFDDFRRVIGGYLTMYEHTPQRGTLQGRAPAGIYRMAVEEGWQRVDVDRRQLLSVFATDDTRQVSQGGIKFAGRNWTCDELTRHLGKTVTIRIPKFVEPAHVAVLPVLDASGQLLGFAEPAERFSILDKRGAREASRQAKLRENAVRSLERRAPEISTTAEVMKMAGALPPLPAAPIAGTISVNTEIAAGLAEPPEERADRKRREKLREHEKRTQQLEWMHQRLTGASK